MPVTDNVIIAGAFAALVALASGAGAQGLPSGPIEVGVVEMTMQEVPQSVTLPGRAVAYQEVELRPRVGGVIEEILYTPGQQLEVDDPLFRIDDSSYVAAVASAQADVITAQANLSTAQSAYERAERLAGSGYTEAEVEAARAEFAEAQATLDAAKAALDYAQTELSWTTVTSPISGRADVSTVSVGDLVTAGQSDELTTIVRSDPIYVDMMETSTRILSMQKGVREGSLKVNDELKATLVLENGDIYHGSGKLVTPGTSVSTTTGTVTVRFQFDNPHHLIIPGMFLRGEIEIGTVEGFLVPQLAATRANSGLLTAYVVGDDGTAQQVTLSEEGSYQNSWVVLEGLEEGDRLIVDGLSSLRSGQEVTPVPAIIDEDGIVRDADSSEAQN